MRPVVLTFLFAAVLFAGFPDPANAQDRRPSHCIALADATPGIEFLHRASFSAPLERNTVRLSYIAHSMYLLETEGGLSAVTDYTRFIGPTRHVPDVVTMNHAHDSHWTASPDPAIPHVLKGWGNGREPADHHLDLGEMLVRNVATDIRSRYFDDVEKFGNSIFVFEVAGLCIGHLGHLHHEPDAQQYAALGRLDVVMAAVDGGMTVDLPTMIRILKRLRSSIVLPMHWFEGGSLEFFLAGMSDEFDIQRPGQNWIEVSARSLPSRPTVVVLDPEYLSDN
ncbi:MAG: Zn-dependent hydrolase [Rhodobacteraceae bacterium]|nr:Zn-dependent hydrolase [Paracoccaceae bacterium]